MRRRVLLPTFALVILSVLFSILWRSTPALGAATLPPDFADTLVATVPYPTALAFTPDGRLLISSQTGVLHVHKQGVLLTPAALDLTGKLCNGRERGILGVAVDPAFATTRYIYLYYTFNKFGVCEYNTTKSPVNRVSRFTLSDNNSVDPATERVLVDNIPSPSGIHNAGDLHFGKDGLLYISIGDGGCDYLDKTQCAGNNDAARDQHILLGKILRITKDGAIPSTNPFQGTDSARCNTTGRTDTGKKCQETFAWGLRNPFRMAFDPNSAGTRFFVNDVGQNLWEEINLGQAGADYGWNVREGLCVNGSTSNCGTPPAGMTNPSYTYGHNAGCESITGGAFVPNGVWPADYDNTYLYGDYVCGKIFKLAAKAGGGYTAAEFVTGLGSSSAVTMIFGPHTTTKALYYTTYANGGEVRRIAYTGTDNRAPVAVAAANPTTGPAPLTVSFDGSGSSDPDGDPLTYEWDFGDGSARVASAKTTHTYASGGTFTATLRVRDDQGTTAAATVRINVGNTPPTPTITAPTASTRFRAGQTITLQGSASDAQDGTLPDSSLSWTVLLHHDTHTHPFLGPTIGNNVTFTAPGPEDLAATKNSYLEIQLTATDSKGLSSVVKQDLLPKQVDVAFATNPTGLKLEVNGTKLTAPTTLTSWEGYPLNVNAPAQTDTLDRTYVFAGWSDGGAAAHKIITPSSAATYTARYTAIGTGTGLTGRYYDNMDFTSLKLTRTDPTVNFNWGSGSPSESIGVDSFSVRWQGYVVPRYTETYTFYTTNDDGARLWVNGQQVVNDWTSHAARENQGQITLTAGQKYTIKLEYYEQSSGAVARLAWSSPSQAKEIIPASRLYPANGLTGRYYDNMDFTSLKLTRTDPTVNFNWGSGSPNASIGVDSFSVRWQGYVVPRYTETYTFYTTNDDGARLWVNGQQVVNDWTSHAARENQGQITLTAGQKYTIKLEYYEQSSGAVARLAWSSPSQAKEIIPASRLLPPN